MPMDENKIEQIFDGAVHLAYSSVSDPSDELILSLFSWLVYTCGGYGPAPLH